MARESTLDLLQAWRDAERRWDSIDPSGDPARLAARDVIGRWLKYQEATSPPEELILVTDGGGRYVGASTSALAEVGYTLAELTALSVADLTPPALAADEQNLWEAFLRDGHQTGSYELRRRDGTTVLSAYRARAHHPVPGYHTSRLRRVGAARTDGG